MLNAIKQKAVVGKDGKIELSTTELPEGIVVEVIVLALTELPLESLPDAEVLAMCDMQMQAEQQEVFSDLLARHREGEISDLEARQLDELMQVYRRGLISKARALKVAVERGLISPLN